MKHDSSKCSWARDHIDAYLDGDLGARDVPDFETHVQSCDGCREELELAKRLVAELREMPELRCPDAISDRVLAQTGAATDDESWTTRWARVLKEVAHNRVLAPTLAGAFVVVIVVSAAVVGEMRRPKFSNEEIALAEAQLKWTFTYMNEVGRYAGQTMREDVFDGGVVKPVQNAVRNALNDTQDETNNGGQ